MSDNNAVRVEKVVTRGMFALDGGEWEVDNNVWLIGNDDEVIVVDAAHDAAAILAAVGERRVVALICTHGHNDHINVAVEVAAATECEIALHPADLMLWEQEYPGLSPDITLADGGSFEVGGETVHVLHTPGHSPGAVSLHVPSLDVVFSGDTLFQGGPGATGRSFSDFPTIIESIRRKLLALPVDTMVHTGHGDDTSIRAESPHLEEWIARGH